MRKGMKMKVYVRITKQNGDQVDWDIKPFSTDNDESILQKARTFAKQEMKKQSVFSVEIIAREIYNK